MDEREKPVPTFSAILLEPILEAAQRLAALGLLDKAGDPLCQRLGVFTRLLVNVDLHLAHLRRSGGRYIP